MKNFPFKAVNPDTGVEETFWYSRSMAVAVFVFARNSEGEWCVLANKRGPGCPDFVGYWVCPCGYLDFNETIADAVIRECYEETGVTLSKDSLKFIGYNDSPKENRQNVTFTFAAVLDYMPRTSSANNEESETSDIKWISVNELSQYSWAFNHKRLIEEIIITNERI